jgi:hypothetical protein
MRTYKFHSWAIRKALVRSAKAFLPGAVAVLILSLTFAFPGIITGNQTMINIGLVFIPAACLVLVLFLCLDWIDFRFTCFYLTDDSVSRVQYGWITKRIPRNKVVEIRKTYEGLMVFTRNTYLLVPDGLVGEDGVSGDINAKLLKWLPEKQGDTKHIAR